MTSPESESVPLHAGSSPHPARIRAAARQADHAPAMPLEEVRRLADLILANIDSVMSGKQDATRMALTVFLSGGHLLIEDVPGVGKTMLAKALARSVDCTVNRIQFTPDLLPSDVTGVSVYSQADHRFEFQPGAVFANIVIGDEINRASPKTQSALLECMEEGQVTVDGVTHPLQQPFTVVATQNPVEMEGTYALPEAQRDRFMARISMGYPDASAELAMLRSRDTVSPLDELRPVVDAEDLDARCTRPAASTCPTPCRATRSPSCRPRAATRTSAWARAPAPRSSSSAPPRPGRRSTDATSSSPTTSTPSPRPCSRIGSSRPDGRSASAAAGRRRSSRSSSASSPPPPCR